MNNNLEELITALYDMIQDAKSVPLSSDKCIIERDKALDMLDDLSAQLPAELKQARTIVASREELVSQARREAEVIIRNAKAEAEKLIEQETIYQQTLAKCHPQSEGSPGSGHHDLHYPGGDHPRPALCQGLCQLFGRK